MSARIIVLLLALAAPAASQPALVTVEQRPEVIIAATTEAGELRFSSAAWATRLTTGEFAVADRSDASIRILGPDGSLRRSLGRRGAGPGEYRLPVWVGRCTNDSLYVWDASARLTAYSAAATADEAPSTRSVAAGASSLSAGCADNGNIALLQMMQPRRDIAPAHSGELRTGGQYSVVEVVAKLVVVDAAGATNQVRDSFSQGQWVMGQISPQGGMGGVPRPLSSTASFAFSGSTLVLADAATRSVVGIGVDGREKFRFGVTTTARRTSVADYERAVQRAIDLVPPPMREAAAEFLQAIPRPDTIPPFWRVLVDPDGLLWLVVSAEGASETLFRVYTTTGALVAEPRVAGTFVPFEVGRAHLLGNRENAEGEVEILMLRVNRGRQR